MEGTLIWRNDSESPARAPKFSSPPGRRSEWIPAPEHSPLIKVAVYFVGTWDFHHTLEPRAERRGSNGQWGLVSHFSQGRPPHLCGIEENPH